MDSFKEIYADKFYELIILLLSKTSAFAQHIEYRNPMNGDKENLESWHNEARKIAKEYHILLQKKEADFFASLKERLESVENATTKSGSV